MSLLLGSVVLDGCCKESVDECGFTETRFTTDHQSKIGSFASNDFVLLVWQIGHADTI